MWNASRFCVSSLRRGHANLLCIVPILVYVLPKQVHMLIWYDQSNLSQCFYISFFGKKRHKWKWEKVTEISGHIYRFFFREKHLKISPDWTTRRKYQNRFAPGEARTHGLQIMRLTRCLLRYGGTLCCIVKQRNFGIIYLTFLGREDLQLCHYSIALLFIVFG